MRHCHGSLRRVLRRSLLVALCPGLLAGSAPAQDLLDRLPAETLACVRLNGIDTTLTRLDQYLMGATPIPLSLGVMARGRLGGLLGNAALRGLDTAGTLALVVLPASSHPAIGLLVPLQDFPTFVQNSARIQPGAEDGLYQLSGIGSRPWLMTQLDADYALLSPGAPAALTALKSQLSGSMGPLKPALTPAERVAARQSLWVYVNTGRIGSLLAPQVEQLLATAQGLAALSGHAAAASADQMQQAATQAATLCRRLSEETRHLTLGLHPDAQDLGLSVHLEAVAETSLARSLATAGTPRDSSLLGFLDEGSVLTLSGNLMGRLAETWGAALAAKLPVQDPDQRATLQEQLRAVGGHFRGSDALAVRLTPQSPPYVSVQVVAEVRDAATLRQRIGALAQGVQALLPASGPTLAWEAAADQQGPVAVGAGHWTLPAGKGSARTVETRVACSDGLMLLSLGSEADLGIKTLVERAADAGKRRPPQDVTRLLSEKPLVETADAVAVLNLQRLIQQVPQPGAAPSGMPLMPSRSGMVAQLALASGHADFGLTLPKTHLQEVTQAVQLMLMQRLMQPSGSTPPR